MNKAGIRLSILLLLISMPQKHNISGLYHMQFLFLQIYKFANFQNRST